MVRGAGDYNTTKKQFRGSPHNHKRSINLAVNDDISSIAAKEWRAFVEPRLPIGERLIPQINGPEDPQLRQELYRATFS